MCAFERGRFPGDIGEKFFNISDRIWHFGTDLIKNGFFWIKLNRVAAKRRTTPTSDHKRMKNNTGSLPPESAEQKGQSRCNNAGPSPARSPAHKWESPPKVG